MCGTWVCGQCGHKRFYANRYSPEPQDCSRCHSTPGFMLPIMHADLGRADDHIKFAESMTREPRYPL